MKTIKAMLKTYRDAELYKVTGSCFGSDELLEVSVESSDIGIAALTAYLYFKSKGAVSPRLVSVEGELGDCYVIGDLSNELLANHLEIENAPLIAAFISLCEFGWLCEGRPIEVLEEELRQLEIRSNTAASDGKPVCGYKCDEGKLFSPSVDEIKARQSYVWKSYIFKESTDMSLEQLRAFDFASNLTDADGFLYITYLMCLWGGL